MTTKEKVVDREVLVNWYCTRRHYAAGPRDRQFLCGTGYGSELFVFEEWQKRGNGNAKAKEWSAIPMCKSCLKRAGESTVQPMTPEAYVYAVAELVCDFDLGDEIMWHRGGGFMVRVDADGNKVPDDRPLVAAVNCSDMFYWACADAEDILPEELGGLRATLVEVGDFHGGLMWVARKRGMRPQMAYLNRHRDEKDFPLEAFLAAGPERTRASEG